MAATVSADGQQDGQKAGHRRRAAPVSIALPAALAPTALAPTGSDHMLPLDGGRCVRRRPRPAPGVGHRPARVPGDQNHHARVRVFGRVLDGCLGGDESSWSAMFDGNHSNITMSGDAGETSIMTPLKVTHSANCRTTAPTLTVQMDTAMSGTLKDRRGGQCGLSAGGHIRAFFQVFIWSTSEGQTSPSTRRSL